MGRMARNKGKTMSTMRTASLLLASTLLWSGAVTAAPATGSRAATAAHKPQVAAHRGGAMHRPENTLAAFAHAAALGVEMLELDMVMSADDALVVHHDTELDPAVCRGAIPANMPIRALSLAQLQQLDCGSTVRPGYAVPGFEPVPGAQMPTLEAVLAAHADSPLGFFAETKMPAPADGVADVDPLAFAHRIDALVRQYGVEARFILQSRDARTLQAMARVNPHIRTCLYGRDVRDAVDVLATLRRIGASCTLLPASHTSPAQVAELQGHGILVFSEVVDDAAGWQRYRALGSDVIITNHPQGALDYLRRPASAPAGAH